MKLILYNGSPRGKKSNTKLLMDEFVKGIYTSGTYDVEIYYLYSRNQRTKGAQAFPTADKVILAFPLYTDSMPGLVKEFIELLSDFAGKESNPNIGFVVQSGFPEPAHSRHVEKYLKNLALRLNSDYLGTVVKGGVEGIQIMPGWMTKKILKKFYRLGRNFNQTGTFDRAIIKKLAPNEQMKRSGLIIFRLLQNTSLGNFYWNNQLKENNVFDQRFAAPYSSYETAYE